MGINVLSLFDGMSCGQLALDKLDIDVDNYYASEIDKYAIKVTKHNFPNTIHIGDVTKLDTSILPKIDLLMGGSPCQGFSFSGKRKGSSTKDGIEITTLEQYLELKEEFEFEGESYLFWEYIRVLKELQKINPDIKFLLENVKMESKWKDMFNAAVGVNPIEINSSLVSAQNRVRYYWTNIRGVNKPEDKEIELYDILETKQNVNYKSYTFNVNDIIFINVKPNVQMNIIKNHYTILKSNKPFYIMKVNSDYSNNKVCLTKSITLRARNSSVYVLDRPNKTYRKLTVLECERLQTVPDNYTKVDGVSNTQRYKMLGNGWTIDVIAHILSFMNKPYKQTIDDFLGF